MVAPSDNAEGLPPDYYWRNFRALVGEVLSHHAHLFDPAERERIDTLMALPDGAQKLFVRLLGRKGEVFRRSKLTYVEIDDLDEAVNALRAAGFVEPDPDRCFADGSAVALLTVPELRAIARQIGVEARGRRADVVDALDAWDCSELFKELDQFLLVRDADPFLIAQVVFFGNRHQDLTEFVLTELAISSYADYEVSRHRPLFESRRALDAYLVASVREDESFVAQAERDADTVIRLGDEALGDLEHRPTLPEHAAVVDPSRCDERVIFAGARERERQGDLAGAIEQYAALLRSGRSVRRAARVVDRLGLALHRSGRPEALAEYAEPIVVSPRLDEVSRHIVELRLHRNLLGQNPRDRLRRPTEERMVLTGAGHAGSKALYVDESGTECTVEQAVLSALGGDGFWCEGSLYTTLFGLLFWDEIFAPIEGVFQHRFQDAPLDMDSEWFFTARRPAIERRLATCSKGSVRGLLERGFEQHYGRRCRGVAWEAYDAVDLVRVADAMGPSLVPVLARIAKAPHLHRAGLPDLFVFVDGKARLVEVKGPGDQVSVEQALWHDALIEAGADVRLIRVDRLE